MTGSAALPEFHRPIAVGQIGAAGLVCEVVAGPDECVAVAARLLIPAVSALTCRFRLSIAGGGVVQAEGMLTARVTQDCVVTLEPFDMDVAEVFRVRFVPEAQFDSEDDSIDLESDDEIPYSGVHLDLGDAAVEQLALALDPYPRSPGAELPVAGESGETSAQDDAVSPFAALARRTQRG